MKSGALPLLFAAGMLLFSGCASTYEMKVDALSRPKIEPGGSYRIVNRNPNVDSDSLHYKEIEKAVKTALSGKGMYEAPDPAKADVVVNLEVPESVVEERITKRRVCRTCGHIYSVDAPPKNGWICDVDGGEVVQRADDTAEAVRKRLDLYAAETLPLVPFYAERGLLVEVDGLGTTDDVFARVLAAIDAHR